MAMLHVHVQLHTQYMLCGSCCMALSILHAMYLPHVVAHALFHVHAACQ
jgi:hypothetical protein